MSEPSKAPSPPEILDLSEACVKFVERALGVRLDYQPETLSLLDHYVGLTRREAKEKPEAVEVVAVAAGAYLGEIVRRRYPCWWRVEHGTGEARLEFAEIFLSFCPMDMVRAALTLAPTSIPVQRQELNGKHPPDDEDEEGLVAATDPDSEDVQNASTEHLDQLAGFDLAGFDLDEADHSVAAERLAELPAVPLEEYYAPSTRLEVLDITIDAVRSKRLADRDPELDLEPSDYD